MTPQIALTLSLLGAAMVLLVTEWIPMEVTALLVLGVAALTGLVSPQDALAGFSNPAVVTVWAVFILSGGLQRTGVANVIGRHVLRWAGHGETRIVAVVMVTAGVMSAFMNNVAVAALLLPVTMDIGRRTGVAPSRLLLPLAYGSLLGGLTTMIGTPPNILVSEILRENGMPPFRLFDYTPVGLIIMVAGTAFVALAGRRLLPQRDLVKEAAPTGTAVLPQQYELRERMFVMRLAADSPLVGRSLAESRLGAVLGLHIISITRGGVTHSAPGPGERLQAGDRLLVQGRLERMNALSGWRELTLAETPGALEELLSGETAIVEAHLSDASVLLGKTVNEVGFRRRYGLNVLAIQRAAGLRRTRLQEEPLEAGDRLLLHGPRARADALGQATADFQAVRLVPVEELRDNYRLPDRLLVLQVPEVSILIGKTLRESRLGDALDLRVLGIIRADGTHRTPEPDEQLAAGDRLVATGRPDELAIVRGLEGLTIESEVPPDLEQLQSAQVGLVEAILAPRSQLAGKSLRELNFREKYGLSVLAIWRSGRAYRTHLRDLALRFGDALLLYGPRQQLRLLGREPDFLVLTEAAQEVPSLEKAKRSTLVMALVLVPVLFGVVPIYIAAVVGAALMVLTRCLTMEEAYRCIEWKAVFLIAGMLPLGVALDGTGAARFLAEQVVGVAGPLGPLAVMAGLVVLTFLATSIVPTAALVVLMSPIILKTAADLGVSPRTMMMAMAMAASASFTSPVAHPANVLVMGPGGYRFRDYLKLGVPLTLVTLVVILLVVPILWPFAEP